MMLLQLLAVERLKVRRKAIWPLIAAGGFGVVLLQAANYALRYDYLMELNADDPWGHLLSETHFLAVPSLIMGLAIIASMIAGVEHATNAWKQTLALPLSRLSVYAAKFVMLIGLMFAACTMLAVGTIILGLCLSIGTDIPYDELLRVCYLPLLAALPIGAVQLWLSVSLANQAIPLTVGVLGTVVSMFGGALRDFVPYKWPMLDNQWNEPLIPAALGLVVGLCIYLAGSVHFVRKDVK
ncbi:ABC transporter permease [Paenibacillus sp. CCS19]|uniref:ABC transporter permease n=1 Tax=Paenibacillus sp. CCS19 TaxID=3158387 RepID=UPI00295E96E4|nr:ABC transporter permease [Paenibacillus cellulosilyticus]